jgi:hypothetical protein
MIYYRSATFDMQAWHLEIFILAIEMQTGKSFGCDITFKGYNQSI